MRSEASHSSRVIRLDSGRYLVTDLDNTIIDSRARFDRAVSEATGNPLEAAQHLSNTRSLTRDQRNRFYDVFLSCRYMDLDIPVRGSVEALSKLKSIGFGIIYLTGRHHSSEESLKYETLKTLAHYGYPMPNGSTVRLYMKPSKMSPTSEYKRNTLGRLAKNVNIVVGVDDEVNDLRVMIDFVPLVIGIYLSLQTRNEISSSLKIPLAKDWFEVESIMTQRKII